LSPETKSKHKNQNSKENTNNEKKLKELNKTGRSKASQHEKCALNRIATIR